MNEQSKKIELSFHNEIDIELNIEQLMQKGISAQQAGKLQEAESCYKNILQTQSTHLHANHNLGVLKISINEVGEALSFFRTALKSNPNIEQFWISYIDALIKDHQYDNAKQVIQQAKKYWNVAPEKLMDFETHLVSITQKENTNSINPPEKQLKYLLEYYQTGYYVDAERLALSLSEEFPNDNFSLKILGAIFKKTGRTSQAISTGKKTIEINRYDPEAYYNFGNTLKDLERLDEAEDSYKHAIALKANYAEAYCNLSSILQEMGRFKEAEVNCMQAILFEPNYTEAYINLGVILKDLSRFKEAEISCKKAVALRKDSADAHSNLGLVLLEQGRLDEAKASCNQAISIKSDDAESIFNLSVILFYMNDLNNTIYSLQNILQIDSNNYGLRARVFLAILNFLEGDFKESKKNLLASSKIQEKLHHKFKNEKIYHIYLLNILNWHENNIFNNSNLIVNKDLYVIGDSHSLTNHSLKFKSFQGNFLCKSKLIMGCKQWDLGNSNINKFKVKFENILNSLPKSSEVLLIFGEIDCRLDSGIIKHKNKFPRKSLKEITVTTVENYLTYVFKQNTNYKHNIIIQGVPCPNIDIEKHSPKSVSKLIRTVSILNSEIKKKSKEKGFKFLDVHKFTNRGNVLSNKIWHADDYHLSAEGILEAWHRYNLEQKYA